MCSVRKRGTGCERTGESRSRGSERRGARGRQGGALRWWREAPFWHFPRRESDKVVAREVYFRSCPCCCRTELDVTSAVVTSLATRMEEEDRHEDHAPYHRLHRRADPRVRLL